MWHMSRCVSWYRFLLAIFIQHLAFFFSKKFLFSNHNKEKIEANQFDLFGIKMFVSVYFAFFFFAFFSTYLALMARTKNRTKKMIKSRESPSTMKIVS